MVFFRSYQTREKIWYLNSVTSTSPRNKKRYETLLANWGTYGIGHGGFQIITGRGRTKLEGRDSTVSKLLI